MVAPKITNTFECPKLQSARTNLHDFWWHSSTLFVKHIASGATVTSISVTKSNLLKPAFTLTLVQSLHCA